MQRGCQQLFCQQCHRCLLLNLKFMPKLTFDSRLKKSLPTFRLGNLEGRPAGGRQGPHLATSAERRHKHWNCRPGWSNHAWLHACQRGLWGSVFLLRFPPMKIDIILGGALQWGWEPGCRHWSLCWERWGGWGGGGDPLQISTGTYTSLKNPNEVVSRNMNMIYK